MKKPDPMAVEIALERVRSGHKNADDLAVLAAEVEQLRAAAPKTEEERAAEARDRRVKFALTRAEQGWQMATPNDVWSDATVLAIEVKRLAAVADQWKRRAAQHGCNVEEGDHECG